MRCHNCGFMNTNDAVYCKQCGNLLKGGKKRVDIPEEEGKIGMAIAAMVISLLGWIYYLISRLVGHFVEELPGVLNVGFISPVLAALGMVLSVIALVRRRTRKSGKVIAAIILILSIVLFVLSIIALILK